MASVRFCARGGIAASSFSSWKTELAWRDSERPAKETAAASLPVFVPLSQPVSDADLTVINASASAIAEIDLSTGNVKLFSGIDQHSLRDIFKAIREVSFD